MCFNGQKSVDCTKNFPKLLQQDLNESRKAIRSPSDYLNDEIDAFHTELIFFIATSVTLGK